MPLVEFQRRNVFICSSSESCAAGITVRWVSDFRAVKELLQDAGRPVSFNWAAFFTVTNVPDGLTPFGRLDDSKVSLCTTQVLRMLGV